jgi:predicted O-methyltransferase YrrM
MNPIQIGRKRFSDIFWNIIDEKVGDFPFEKIERIVEQQQELRSQAEYNTGSLPVDDAFELYKLVKFFQPKVIAEVGTFIGVSAMTMNLAMERLVDIYTCDHSNAVDLNVPNIFQYPMRASHEMFADMATKNVKADIVYLDGRLSQPDFEPLGKIVTDQTVFVLDDFEGVEKGVANAMVLENARRVLIYPREGRKTAVSFPLPLLQFVPQEAT